MHKSLNNQQKSASWRERKKKQAVTRTYNMTEIVTPVKVPGAILVIALLLKSLYFIHKSLADQQKSASWRERKKKKKKSEQ